MLVPYSLAVQWKVGRGCCFTLNFFFHLMADSNLVSPPRVFNHSSLSCLSSLSLAPLEQSGQDIHATMGTHFTPQPHTDSPKTFLKEVVLSWCYDIATQVPFLNQSDWVYHFVRKHQFLFDGPSTVFLSLVDRSVFRVPPEEPDVVLFMITRLIEPSLRNWMTKI